MPIPTFRNFSLLFCDAIASSQTLAPAKTRNGNFRHSVYCANLCCWLLQNNMLPRPPPPLPLFPFSYSDLILNILYSEKFFWHFSQKINFAPTKLYMSLFLRIRTFWGVIFLPLWFYRKLILAAFRSSKTNVLSILIFGKISHLKMSKVSKNFNIQSWSNCQNGRFWAFKVTKIIFT